jgi:ribosomal protein S12 methylthiotransferase
VTGCLSQRYSGDLAAELPEVDHFLGSSDMPKIRHVLKDSSAERMLVGNPADWVPSASDPRTLSTRGASAYVKIAEGCNRSCSFCVIPNLRGKQRSRTIEDVVREVQQLVDRGVLEVNLVSQDTIAYGRDLSSGENLTELVRRVADVPGLRWLRVFYLYPEKMGDELIELIADHPVIVPYVDMPLQHAADNMLRRMRRGHGGKRLYELVERMKSRIEGLTFRTAFIVGHPGETEEEFQELCNFVTWAEFDRVGVFRYSDEPEAHAYSLEGKVSRGTSYNRARKLMGIQRKQSEKKNRTFRGKQLEVLVEGPSEESELVMVGRHKGQAPDIDGVVYLSGELTRPGSLVQVKISQSTDYDLLGDVDESVPPIFGKNGGTNSPLPTSASIVNRASDGRRVLRTVQ